MTLSEDSEKNEKQRMDLFYSYMKQRADAGEVEGAKAINDIIHEADRYVFHADYRESERGERMGMSYSTCIYFLC